MPVYQKRITKLRVLYQNVMELLKTCENVSQEVMLAIWFYGYYQEGCVCNM